MLEHCNSTLYVLRLLIFFEISSALQIKVVRSRLLRAMFSQQLALLGLKVKFHCPHDAVGDLVLEGEPVRDGGRDGVTSDFAMSSGVYEVVVNSYHIPRATQ